jgi:hypothetical protein
MVVTLVAVQIVVTLVLTGVLARRPGHVTQHERSRQPVIRVTRT